VLLAAGCGEEPSLAKPFADGLAAQTDSAAAQLERENFCAARTAASVVQRRTIAAINDGVVPADLQEELLASVNALVDAISCTPPAADDGAADGARELAAWLRSRSG
jgi:hypothetical protein